MTLFDPLFPVRLDLSTFPNKAHDRLECSVVSVPGCGDRATCPASTRDGSLGFPGWEGAERAPFNGPSSLLQERGAFSSLSLAALRTKSPERGLADQANDRAGFLGCCTLPCTLPTSGAVYPPLPERMTPAPMA